MADGNGATVDVDLLRRKAEDLHVGESDNREGLVDLVEINVLLLDTGMLDGLGNGDSRGSGKALGLVGGITPTKDLGDGLDTKLLKLSLGDKNNGSGTIVDGGGVGSSDGTILGLEDGTGRLEFLDVEVLDLLITVNLDGRLAAATRDLDRNNFLEQTSLGGGLGLLVGVDGILVLGFTAQLMVLGAELGLDTHELLAIGITETIGLNTVDKAAVTVLDASAEVGHIMGDVGHALGAAGDNDIGIASHDGLGAKDDGLHAGSAHLVDGGGDNLVRETGLQGALAGRGLADTGG